jgi:hypothetical protein
VTIKIPAVPDGPLAQTGAPYARVPGIRVYGMLCLKSGTKKRRAKMLSGFEHAAETAGVPEDEGAADVPNFPSQWEKFAASLSDLR